MIKCYLVSDSTVQTYEKYYYPQTGWGQVFWECFKDSDTMKEETCETCSYPQSRDYVLRNITIENRAIGGRSSRSFIEEGKLQEIEPYLSEGDYMFVQFGHNDATINRPERYVASEDFHIYIQKYIDLCKEKKVQCVLVTPVARRNCDDTDVFTISFDEYRKEMIKIAAEQNLPLIDLGKVSADYLNTLGNEKSKELYLHTKEGQYEGAYEKGVQDNTHLSITGARIYAGMVAELIKENPALKDFAEYLKDTGIVGVRST